MDENILEVRHLHTDFVTDEKTVQAVNDVSFEIKRGETPSPIDIPKGCAFHPRCPFATEKCRTAEPVMTEDANGRMVKCHYPLVDGFSMKAVQIP